MEFTTLRHGLLVDPCLLGRRVIVDQQEPIVIAANERVAFFHFHIAEQRDVGVLLAAQRRYGFDYWIFASFLPAAHHLDRSRLKRRLNQG